MAPYGTKDNPWPGIPRALLEAILAGTAWLRAHPDRRALLTLVTSRGYLYGPRSEPGFAFCAAGATALVALPSDLRALAERPWDAFTAARLREAIREKLHEMGMWDYFLVGDPGRTELGADPRPESFYEAVYDRNDTGGEVDAAMDRIEAWAWSLPVIEPDGGGCRDTDPHEPPAGMEHAP